MVRVHLERRRWDGYKCTFGAASARRWAVLHVQMEPFRMVIALTIVSQSSVTGGRLPLSPHTLEPIQSFR